MLRFRYGTGTAWLLGSILLLGACDSGGTAARVPEAVEPTVPLVQEATRGGAVALPPAVRVLDSEGRPLAGVSVSFAVTAGGGTLGVPAATTDAGGNASAGHWTLGMSVGTQAVVATVAGLSPVTFTAQALDPCATLTPYTLLSTVQGDLTSIDCRLDTGEFIDWYSVAFPLQQGVTIRMNAMASLDPFLMLLDPSGAPLALNDDADDGTVNAAIPVFAPAGSYVIGATSYEAGETGGYTLGSTAYTNNTGCAFPWVVSGVQLNQALTTGDCLFEGYYSDLYLIILRPGQQVQVDMQSDQVDAYLLLHDAEWNVLAWDDDGGSGTNARLTYTSSNWSVYVIEASTAFTGETGAYMLSVSTLQPGWSAAATFSRDQTAELGLRPASRDGLSTRLQHHERKR